MATYELPINSPLTETGDDVYCKPTDSDFAGGGTWGTNVVAAIELADTNVYLVTLDETKGYIVYLNGTSNAFTADDSSNEIIDNAHGLLDGEIVRFKGLDLPGGLVQSTRYYVIDKSTNRFRVSLSAGGAAVNLTDAGTGTMVYVATSQRDKTNDVVLGTIPIVSGATLSPEAEASLLEINVIKQTLVGKNIVVDNGDGTYDITVRNAADTLDLAVFRWTPATGAKVIV